MSSLFRSPVADQSSALPIQYYMHLGRNQPASEQVDFDSMPKVDLSDKGQQTEPDRQLIVVNGIIPIARSRLVQSG